MTSRTNRFVPIPNNEDGIVSCSACNKRLKAGSKLERGVFVFDDPNITPDHVEVRKVGDGFEYRTIDLSEPSREWKAPESAPVMCRECESAYDISTGVQIP